VDDSKLTSGDASGLPRSTARHDIGENFSALRSVHTNTFAQILDQCGLSLAVTTYQAGKLVLLRPELHDGKLLVNTHFRNFSKPMGFAWEVGRFAIGTTAEIWEFHDIPPVASKLDALRSSRLSDAVFLPRRCHMTGDVQVHEMAWVANPKVGGSQSSSTRSELWFINTRFSCLATQGDAYSFVPRWQPPFITALAPEDRCHLNGMGVRDGVVRYATALGETDGPGGWRKNKGTGGVLMDVESNQVITWDLSMPHSPRWHNGKLWILESGNGSIGFVDEQNGKFQEICRVPGFARGLDFAGPYAFIGLSQVRETAIFSGIAIAEMREQDRCCGVWIVDINRGEIVGFVKFTDGVQEIFAVQVLVGLRWPEILNEGEKVIAETYELPDDALKKVPPGLRTLAPSHHSIAGIRPNSTQ
jgi:uncharacterized protein (TIGR03032 family)